MPYVDEGDQPKKAGLPTWVPFVAGAVAAGVGVYLWGMLFTAMNNTWLAPLLGGVLVGGAIRLTRRAAIPRVGLFAVILAVAAGVGGFAYRHMFVYTWTNPQTGAVIQPDFSNAMQYLFNDMFSVLLIAFGAYLAYLIAASSIPAATTVAEV
mgnify:CR=1 FL=1